MENSRRQYGRGLGQVKSQSESAAGQFVLRLFLDPTTSIDSAACQGVSWDLLLSMARKNVLVVRTWELLCKKGGTPGDEFARVAEEENERIGATIDLIEAVGEVCEDARIPFMFTKAFSHYPDMGHDVDLLVLDHAGDADQIIAGRIRMHPASSSLVNKVAGKTDYAVDGYPSPLEIHHGRLGQVGEHRAYAESLLQRRRPIKISGITTYVPRREDEVIIQVLQRVYAHRSMRLSNVIGVIQTIRESLDWDYIISTTQELGVFEGLRFLIGSLHRLCLQLFGEDTLDPAVVRLLGDGTSRDMKLHDGQYRFARSVVVGLYARKLRQDLNTGRWGSAGRLCLLPPLAIMAGARTIARRGRSK